MRYSAYLSLTKPRITLMVVITAALGFFLGGHGIHSYSLFFLAMLGTALSSAGAAVLNNYLERDADALMRRTRKRAIPAGLIAPAEALIFGIILVLCGTSLLVWKVNLLAGFLALLTAFLYVLVYTPLKRVTWLNTFVGAIPGALPPMGGWASATNHLELGAWVLFLIMFVWQHPHFYSIAWLYREDYERGGFKMLPVIDPDGTSTFRQIVVYSLLLLPISILPTVLGLSGSVYAVGALCLGFLMLISGIQLWRSHSTTDARRVLHASLLYLPLLLVLIMGDSRF